MAGIKAETCHRPVEDFSAPPTILAFMALRSPLWPVPSEVRDGVLAEARRRRVKPGPLLYQFFVEAWPAYVSRQVDDDLHSTRLPVEVSL